MDFFSPAGQDKQLGPLPTSLYIIPANGLARLASSRLKATSLVKWDENVSM